MDYVAAGERAWTEDPSWGLFGNPEAEVGVLPASVAGLDTIELGCGTGYVSAWLARRGARPVGIDNSEAQLGPQVEPHVGEGIEGPVEHAHDQR